jgi:hypothetical protein
LIPVVGIAVTAVAVMMLVVLVFLIRRKSRELEDPENMDKTSSKAFPPRPNRKFQEGMALNLLWTRPLLTYPYINILFIIFFSFGGLGGIFWGFGVKCRSFIYVPKIHL